METSCSGQVIGLFQLKEKLIREVNSLEWEVPYIIDTWVVISVVCVNI